MKINRSCLLGADDVIVFVDSMIPRKNYEFLCKSGVKSIYSPSTPIVTSAKGVLEQIRKVLKA